MEIVPRDIHILETIGRLGTADTDILRMRHFPHDATGRASQQRLRKLADDELLKRVRLIATDGKLGSGSLPTMYFLTEAGADLVEHETGARPQRVTHTDPKPFTLRHRMEVVRARLAIDAAAKLAGIAAPAWIMEQDCRAGQKSRKGHSPSEFLILFSRYWKDGQQASFRPDAAFHVQLPHKDAFASLLGYVELDRSTEGHLQWKRKMRGIEAFVADSRTWREHWPDISNPLIRVFVLCNTERRISELIATTKDSPAAAHVRFTTFPLQPATVLAGDVWQSCNGELRRILRHVAQQSGYLCSQPITAFEPKGESNGNSENQ
jgi:hypothetical protein